MLHNLAFLLLFCWCTYRVGHALDDGANALLDRVLKYLDRPHK
jgi:hypothetical protein